MSGYSDWRVPNIRELKSLVDHRASLASVLKYAQGVSFSNGVPSAEDKLNSRYVRCVRGGVAEPELQIKITFDSDMVSSGTKNFGFNVRIDNIGRVNLSSIPISIEHATNFAAPVWTCSDEEKSENATCNRIAPSSTKTTFSAYISVDGCYLH